jgi:nucleoside-diphosphate-sugar epimerase
MADDSGCAQRILITGGAGLIGSHMADFLAQKRHTLSCGELIVLDNFVRCSVVWTPIGFLMLISHARHPQA